MEPERPQTTRWYSRLAASVFSTRPPTRVQLSHVQRRGEPPRDPPGGRRLEGLPPRTGSLGREYKGGGGWKSAAIVILVAVIGFAVTTPGFVDRLLHGPPPAAQKIEVLVVSSTDTDIVAARQTLLPRGYPVRAAATAEAAIEEIERTQVGFVLLDGNMAGAKRVASAARFTRPGIRIMTLMGKRDIRDVSERLIAAGF